MTYPKVSIITPTYNHERYIKTCIQSVLDQTYESWEMIIIDDGSTDSTPQKVAEYSDKRIRYIRQENQGKSNLGKTYNYALSLSKGEIVAILEGDDFWSIDKLEKQVTSFEESSVALSFSNYYVAYDSGDSLKYELPKVVHLYIAFENNPLGSALYPLFDGLSPGSVTLMFRKTALLKIGGFQQMYDLPYVDYPTLLAMTLEGRFAYVPETLGYFRRHKGSISSCRLDNQKDIVEVIDKRYKYCKDFLRQNTDKISRLSISIAKLDEISETRRSSAVYLMYIRSGKELFELGDRIGSRKTYGQVLKQDTSPIYKFVAILGLISTYCGIDLCAIMPTLYTRLRKYRLRKMCSGKCVRP